MREIFEGAFLICGNTFTRFKTPILEQNKFLNSYLKYLRFPQNDCANVTENKPKQVHLKVNLCQEHHHHFCYRLRTYQ